MTELHPLLARQLRRLALDRATPPDAAAWEALLSRIDGVYRGADEDRYTMERAFELSSKEMNELYRQLERASAQALAQERDKLARNVAILGATLDTMEDGVMVVGHGDHVLLHNQRFLSLWRVPPELHAPGRDGELLRHCLDRLVDRDTVAAAIADVHHEPMAEREDVLQLLDGRVFRAYSAPVATASERIGRMWIFRDETERRSHEAEIREAKRFLTSILENLPDMVFVKDAETLAFVRFNKAGEDLLGVGRDALIGRTDFDLFPPEQAEHFVARDREVLAAGALSEVEEPILTRDGERLLHTKKIPIADDDGVPRFLLGISRDITERRRRREELQAAKEAAERASRAKSEFLSNMSHELRTPLNGILGFAEMLSHEAIGKLTERQRVCVDDIRRAGSHMAHLVDDLLDLRGIEDQTARPVLDYHALAPIVAEAVTLVTPLAHERRQTLTVASCVGMPSVSCSPRSLLQVLYNLLSNAVKYTEPGGHVTLSAQRTAPDLVEVAVSDDGIGIAPQDLPEVFTYFTQAGAKLQHHMQGAGIGLALTRALVDQMGGSIVAESALGRGSTFRVRLRSRAEAPMTLQRGKRPPPPDTTRMRDACWRYLADAHDSALARTLAEWREGSPVAGVLAFFPEADRGAIPELQAQARALGVPLVGAVFPELVVDAQFQQSGVLLLRLDPMPPWVLVDRLGASPEDDAAAVDALAQLADSASQGHGRDTLYLVFDSLVGHIGTLVERLYGRIGDSVHYAGVNGGSATFQPMPCVFDGERVVDKAGLALLLPDHPGAILDHGYSVPDSQMVATSASGNRIAHIDWTPAFDRYRALVRASYGVDIDRDNFYQLAVHFPFAMMRADGEAIVRIPVAMGDGGELFCVGEIPDGAIVTVARACPPGDLSTVEHLAVGLAGQAGLLFYCEGRRTHLGRAAALDELAAFAGRAIGPVIGAVSLGEIGEARQGGYPLFHNATLVALPWALGGASAS